MKSPYLTHFRKQLSELNNRLSHYIFVWEQFAQDNGDKLDKKRKKQTTEIYPDNRFAKQYDVKLEILAGLHDQTSSFILKSLYILMYTEFEVYMRNVYELARKVKRELRDLTIQARVPDRVFEFLNLELETVFDQKERWTFDYFRHRRNRLVHTGGQSKGEMINIIKNHGNALQKYWNEELTRGLFGADFQSEQIDQFSKEEIFDFINIWRKLVAKIDQIICLTIEEDKFIKYIYPIFLEERAVDVKRWGPKRTAVKFAVFCKMNYGLDLTGEQLEDLDNKNGEVA